MRSVDHSILVGGSMGRSPRSMGGTKSHAVAPAIDIIQIDIIDDDVLSRVGELLGEHLGAIAADGPVPSVETTLSESCEIAGGGFKPPICGI